MSETYTIGRWTERPYTSHDKRHIKVKHRVRVLVYDGGFTDVVHERRRRDKHNWLDDWKEVETVEVRDYGATYRKARDGVLQE